jgi:hypothetical protein
MVYANAVKDSKGSIVGKKLVSITVIQKEFVKKIKNANVKKVFYLII